MQVPGETEAQDRGQDMLLNPLLGNRLDKFNPKGPPSGGKTPLTLTLKERSPFSSESWLILRSIWLFSVFRSWHCFRVSWSRTVRLRGREQ